MKIAFPPIFRILCSDTQATSIHSPARSILIICSLAFLLVRCTTAPVEEEHPYIPPAHPAVSEKLAEWQDWKFGVLIHWGPYSQWGVVESWSLCPRPPLSLLLTL